jgi:pentatricopeptide repeat protein
LQIFEEIEVAKRRYGKLNTIVMNAVLQACVRCADVDSALKIFDEMSKPDSCGVDSVTYGTLLKVLQLKIKMSAFVVYLSVSVIGAFVFVFFLMYLSNGKGLGFGSKN